MKTKRNVTRVLSVMLVLVMLMGVFTACPVKVSADSTVKARLDSL